MDFERLTRQERYDALTEIADMYYNQGKTQAEIANHFSTNRFRIAKLLQDARAEQVVEIRINYANQRNQSMEQELTDRYPLSGAVVVNTQYSSYADSCSQVGQAGAVLLHKLLTAGSVLGITWGKTIQTVVNRLPQTFHTPISVVQMAGHISLANPSAESRELARTAAFAHFGNVYYLNAPLYVHDPSLRQGLLAEPDLYRTLCKAREMNVFLTGIGSRSSLPLANPAFRPYLSARDLAAADQCVGSILGYVLDSSGQTADLDLNQKVMALPPEELKAVPHRIAIAYGRHKVPVIRLAVTQGWVNELVTDMDTALMLLD
ncbi:MAG: hypothetical protein HFG63_08840 [Lachnospiraceae bacterium]|nr:hypothetical protein [Lachnospiraceae bacterium]